MKAINGRGFLNGLLAGTAVGIVVAGLLSPRAAAEIPGRVLSGGRVVGGQAGRAVRSVGYGVRRMLKK